MILYSLEKSKRDENQNNLYDLIYPLLSHKNKPSNINEYIVGPNREMRLDLICNDIYGSIIYVDELMYLNGIIDPYSVKVGDKIKWAPIDELKRFRQNYDNSSQLKTDLSNNRNYTYTSPNDNYIPVMVDKEKNEIIITNKLK